MDLDKPSLDTEHVYINSSINMFLSKQHYSLTADFRLFHIGVLIMIFTHSPSIAV